MDKTASNGMAKGLLLGLGIGAAAGILFAPRKGEETRAIIRQKAMENRDKMKRQMAQKTGRAKEAASKAAESSKQTASKISNDTAPR